MRNTILPRSTLMNQSVYQNSLLESESSHSGCCITRYDQKLLKTASVVFATQFASLLLRIFTLAINHVYNLGQVLCESSSLGNSLSLVGFFFHFLLSFLMSLPSSSRRAVSVQRKHFLALIWSTNSALTIHSSSF